MSKKVLGIYEKDSTIHETRFGIWYEIHKNNLVSVRLASESVDLEWLGREFAKRKYMSKDGVMVIDCYPLWRKIQDVAEKEAKR